jgi:hypothetical protein
MKHKKVARKQTGGGSVTADAQPVDDDQDNMSSSSGMAD